MWFKAVFPHTAMGSLHKYIHTTLNFSLFFFFSPLSLCLHSYTKGKKKKKRLFYGVDEGEMQGVHSECLN